MEHYLKRGDFVAEDRTAFTRAPEDEYRRPGVFLQGGIACFGNLVVTVHKFLEILSDPDEENPLVETRFYKYNLSVRGYDTVFRYDNDHPWFLHPGHHDPHHRHEFDWRAGKELKSRSPEWIGAARWPHLNAVINEARDWYHLNRHELPEPDAIPDVSGAR